MLVSAFRRRREGVSLRAAPVPLIAALVMATATPVTAQSTDSPFTWGSRYDSAGRVTGHIAPDPDGPTLPLKFAADRTEFDAAGRQTRTESGELATWQDETVAPAAWSSFTVLQRVDTVYDPRGLKLKETLSGVPSSGGVLAVQTVVEYSYDDDGRLLCKAVRMNPAEFALQRDACTPGTPSTAYGPDRITSNTYDVAGQLVQYREGVGTGDMAVEATRDYTPNGKLKVLIDANGNRAEMRYDEFDRLQCWILPSQTRAAAYNPATQATALASAGALGGDCSTGDFEFYGYDAGSNRTSFRKRDGSILTFQYDELDRMKVKIVPERAGLTAAQTRDVYYSYDLRGLQTKARFDSLAGEGIANEYDGFGQLASSTITMEGTSRTFSYQYDANGNRLRITHPAAIVSTHPQLGMLTFFYDYKYDGLDRPLSVANAGGGVLASWTYESGGRLGTLARMGTPSVYGYDGGSRIASIAHDLAGTTYDLTFGFAYNPASQIVTRTSSNDVYASNTAYNVGRSYSANGLNQYVSVGPNPYTYDANGNLTSDGVTGFVYDVENRLVSASGAKNAALVYDPLGRLHQTSGGAAGTLQFLYDGDALVAEYESAQVRPRLYVHGIGADVPLVWFEGGGGGRGLYTDHQGSVMAYAHPTNAYLAINGYDAWGIPNAGNQGRFGYTGQAWIPELGLWYYKARFYSPTLGRFMQTDPVGYEDQVNLYAYVDNDPVNRTDPSGEEGACTYTADECGMKTTDPDRINRQVNAGKVMVVSAGVATGGIIGNAMRVGAVMALQAARVMAHQSARAAWNAAWREAGFKTAGDVGKVVGWGNGRTAVADTLARVGQIDRAAVSAMRQSGLTRKVAEAALRLYRAAERVNKGDRVAGARAELMRRILDKW